MSRTMRTVATALALLAILPATAVLAQARQPQHIFLPNVSQRAEVAQTIGVTDVRVVYHRPGVNDRQIWGGLVPYDAVWRTGANENTLISFSTGVQIEGQDLAAGTYGLHTQPTAGDWQVIFSRDTRAWGSFAYDEANDALRVTVTPEEAEHVERMVFTFDDPAADSVTLALRWEKLRVPISIELDSTAETLASIREQLTGLAQFFWQGWDQAASWAVGADVEIEQGLEWAERSIGIQENFVNLTTKVRLLIKLGREDEAAAVMERALPMGNARHLFNYGQLLLGRGEVDEAVRVFEMNVEKNPDVWFVELGLARGLSAKGEFARAAEAMRKSLAKAPEGRKPHLEVLVKRLEGGEDIN